MSRKASPGEPLVSIVTSVHNESLTVPDLFRYLDEIRTDERFEFQIIIVDNASTDETLQILRSKAKPEDTIVSVRDSKGWGGGLKAGLRHAEGDYILIFPSDLQYPLDSVRVVLNRLSDLAGNRSIAIFASRKFRRDGVVNSLRGLVWAKILRRAMGSTLEDLAGQLRAYSRVDFDYDRFPDSFLFDAHFAVTWLKSKKPFEEVPVFFDRRTFGRSSNGSYIRSTANAILLLVQYLRAHSND